MSIKKIIFLFLIQSLLSSCDFLSGDFTTTNLVQPNQQSCIISTLDKISEIKFMKETRWESENIPIIERIYNTDLAIPSYTGGLFPIYLEKIPLKLKVKLSRSEKKVRFDISVFDRHIPAETMVEITKLMNRIKFQLSKNCRIHSFN